MKTRITLLFIAFLGVWAALVGRAAYLQFFPHDRLAQLQDKQFQARISIEPRRGMILDRNKKELALSKRVYSLYADPAVIAEPRKTSRRLAKVLRQNPANILAKIKNKNKRFIWIDREISDEAAQAIRKLDIHGLQLSEEYRRVYPKENLLAGSLGMVGSSGQGLEGLELQFNSYLKGETKKIIVPRDARGRILSSVSRDEVEGQSVILTIDSEVQHVLEKELMQSIKEYEAEQAFGVVLDAQTSEVIAMGALPSFDANKGNDLSPSVRRNRVITDTFEPGSTMKSFVVAAALRKKMLVPNTRYNTENGSMKIGKRTIREADEKHHWQSLTVSEILAYSSNIGTTKIAFQLGAENLRQALLDFGFGQKTGIDLPGDGKGLLQQLPWSEHLLSNISFGHGIAVTPLQLANAYAVIANGGMLRQPKILKSVIDPDTGEETVIEREEGRRILSPEDAASMRLILAGVTVDKGTGANAAVEGYVVAGKTGTAQKVKPDGRGYIQGGYISSFAGFIPANDPRYVIYVAVDHPKKAYYGSQVAAPMFSRVASYLARREGLAPLLLTEKNIVPKIEKTSVNEKITAQGLVPQLTDMPLRQVIQKLSGSGAQVQIIGRGKVAETIPAAGDAWPTDRVIKLYLKE